jgi:hypothetical protein
MARRLYARDLHELQTRRSTALDRDVGFRAAEVFRNQGDRFLIRFAVDRR